MHSIRHLSGLNQTPNESTPNNQCILKQITLHAMFISIAIIIYILIFTFYNN